jgi:hypothetical protein
MRRREPWTHAPRGSVRLSMHSPRSAARRAAPGVRASFSPTRAPAFSRPPCEAMPSSSRRRASRPAPWPWRAPMPDAAGWALSGHPFRRSARASSPVGARPARRAGLRSSALLIYSVPEPAPPTQAGAQAPAQGAPAAAPRRTRSRATPGRMRMSSTRNARACAVATGAKKRQPQEPHARAVNSAGPATTARRADVPTAWPR